MTDDLDAIDRGLFVNVEDFADRALLGGDTFARSRTKIGPGEWISIVAASI